MKIKFLAIGFAAVTASAVWADAPDMEHLRQRADRLYRSFGNIRPVDTPPGNRAAAVAAGDEICGGNIRIYNRPVEIGSRNIDWSGVAWSSREHTAYLNRMEYLPLLAGAWQETRDPKYSQRAAELIGDWMDWIDRARKTDPGLFDPDRNNQLNTAIRLRNWIETLARLRQAPGFDDALVARMLREITVQGNGLAKNTAPGPGNWPVFQAAALLDAGLVLDFLPEAPAWRDHAVKVLDRCFVLNFRPDGVHRENTPNYHYGPAWHFSNAFNLQRDFPEVKFRNLNRDDFRRIADFNVLSQSFPFNDTGYRQFVSQGGTPGRYDRAAPSMVSWAKEKLGLADWDAPVFGIFPDAGLVFGGNVREKVFFDAGKFGSWHCHYSRLEVCYNRDGFVLIADPGMSSYNYQKPEILPMFIAGRETAAHPTVRFDRGCQLRRSAELFDSALGPDFAWALGEYQGGYYLGAWKNYVPENRNIEAVHRRAVLWLADDGLLILDRTRVERAPAGDKTVTNLVFPLAPQEKWTLDQEKLRFVTENKAMPNFSIQLLNPPPGMPVRLICDEGVKEPAMRGWLFADAENPVKAPWVEYQIPGGLNETTLATRVTSAPAGEKTLSFTVKSAAPGAIDLVREDGGLELIRFTPDFQRIRPLSAAGVTRECSLLIVRCDPAGKETRIFVARMPYVDGIQNAELFTGFIRPDGTPSVAETR